MSESTAGKQWFGHPRGLSTLFFTEMGERFSYYGMRALLMLFMTATAANSGLGFTDTKAGAIYGLFTAGVYLLTLPGGWIADRIMGQRRSVFWGGVLIALGNFSLAVPGLAMFYFGLVLIVLGTGLLKANVSTIVGDIYPEGGPRRDAGFSIFYMGINIGAFAAPLICGPLGQRVNWHLGFLISGIAMVCGLIWYKLDEKNLGDAGQWRPGPRGEDGRRASIRQLWLAIGVLATVFAIVAYLSATGVLNFSSEEISLATLVVLVLLVLLYFGYLMGFGGLTGEEKKGVGVIFLLFLASAIFWGGFEQAGSSMNIFAERLTNLNVFGLDVPASTLQSVNSVFIILLAPVFATIWQALSRRNRNPHMGLKFSGGLVLLGVGFVVMIFGAMATQGGTFKVLPTWLIATYFFHTLGELCLSPVGLSSITKLAPRRLGGQMMGVWFMGAALGNLVAGIYGGRIAGSARPGDFGLVAAVAIGAGLLLPLLFIGRWAKSAMAKAEGQ